MSPKVIHGVPADPFLGGLRSIDNMGVLNFGIIDSKNVGFEASDVSVRDLVVVGNIQEYSIQQCLN